MDWVVLSIAAAAGALGGALGWLGTRRAKDPRGQRTTIVRVACVVVAVVVSQQIAAPLAKARRIRREVHAAGLQLYGNEESAKLNAEILAPIIMRFEPRLRALQTSSARDHAAFSSGPVNTRVAALVAAGMARLDAADQATIFDAKVVLTERSPALCAGFWTGNVSGQDIADGMHALDMGRQRAWITISGRALTRELEADRAPAPPAGPGQDALAELMQTLAPDQRAAFTAAAQGAPTPEIACRAFRALAAGMRNVGDEKRAAILRLLSASAASSR